MCRIGSKKMGFTEDQVEDLKTAVAEACLNAIEHGNKMDTSTKVGITLTIDEMGVTHVLVFFAVASLKSRAKCIKEHLTN